MGTAQVAQFDILELMPDAFDGIQFWRIARQWLQVDGFGAPRGQEGFDCGGPMDRRAVPDDQQLLCDMAQQVFQKQFTLLPAQRRLSHQSIQLATRRDRTHYRQMIASQDWAQHSGLSTRGIGPDHGGQ